MSKALTSQRRKFKGDVDLTPHRISDWKLNGHFPSYFGNFGIFNGPLSLRTLMWLVKRRLCRKHEFPLITAIMAIV
jgi:hypothetical protein